MQKKTLLIISIFVLFQCISAKHRLDSLKSELIKYSDLKNDSLYNTILKEVVIIYKDYDLSKSIQYAKNGLLLAKRINNIDNQEFWYGQLGELYVFQDEQLLALEAYQHGIDLTKKNNKNTAWWHIDIGNVYFADNLNIKKAEKNYLFALQEFENFKDKDNGKKGKAVALNNLGLIESGRGNKERAIAYFIKGLNIRKSLKDKYLIRHSYMLIANEYIELDIFKAKIYFDSVYQIVKGTDHEFDYYLKISDFHRKTKDYTKAIIEIEKAEKIALKSEINTYLPLVYREFSSIYLDINNLKKASFYAEKGLSYANMYKLTNYSLLLLEQLIEINSRSKNFTNAYNYQKKFLEIKTELHEKELRNAEINYELEENAKETFILKENLDKITALEHSMVNKNIKQRDFIVQIEWAIVILLVFALLIIWSLFKQTKQKKIIELSHKEILGSINYAKSIQKAILPKTDIFDYLFDDYFLISEPKDGLSGDFYQAKISEKNIIIAIGDCTGHGVPGAMLSVLGVSFLNDIFRREEVERPSDALEELKYQIISNFQNSEKSDGMDIALFVISKTEPKLTFAGAFINLYLIRNNEITIYSATRTSIGVVYKDIPFDNQEIELQKGDRIYIFTDGFSDQIGGDSKNTRKFSKKRILQILSENNDKTLKIQKTILLAELRNWQGKEEQTDDITFFGMEY